MMKRFLRDAGVVFTLTCAIFFTYHTVRLCVSFVGEMIWRLQKGYLAWEIQTSMAAIILFMAALSAFWFLIANALYRLDWSRRSLIKITLVGGIALMSLITAITIFVITYDPID